MAPPMHSSDPRPTTRLGGGADDYEEVSFGVAWCVWENEWTLLLSYTLFQKQFTTILNLQVKTYELLMLWNYRYVHTYSCEDIT